MKKFLITAGLILIILICLVLVLILGGQPTLDIKSKDNQTKTYLSEIQDYSQVYKSTQGSYLGICKDQKVIGFMQDANKVAGNNSATCVDATSSFLTQILLPTYSQYWCVDPNNATSSPDEIINAVVCNASSDATTTPPQNSASLNMETVPNQGTSTIYWDSNSDIGYKYNSSDKTKIDVYVKDSSGNEKFFVTLSNFQTEFFCDQNSTVNCKILPLSYSIEFHNGDLYVVRRIGNDTYPSTAWTDELWKYNSLGVGQEIYSQQGLDFRVSSDEKYIAISSTTDMDGNQTYKIYRNTKNLLNSQDLVKVLPYNGLQAIMWYSHILWLEDSHTADNGYISTITKFDADSLSMTDYNVLKILNLETLRDVRINPEKESILFDNYPWTNDDSSYIDDYLSQHPTVSLYLYDLNSGKETTIATSSKKMFNEKWINDTEVQYDNPNGIGTVIKLVY